MKSPIIIALLALSILAGWRSECIAQWNQSYSGGFNATYGYGNNQIWNDRVLQKQLDLSREQRRELLEIKLDYDDEIGGLQLQIQRLNARRYKYNSKGTYEINAEVQAELAELNKSLTKINKQYVDRGNAVLLPHQRESLKQIRLKKSVQGRGFIQVLTSGRLDQVLDLTPEQKKRLAERKKELDQELTQMVAEAMADIKDELLKELEPDQRQLARQAFDGYEYGVKRNHFSFLQYESYFMKKKKDSDD